MSSVSECAQAVAGGATQAFLIGSRREPVPMAFETLRVREAQEGIVSWERL
jgi:hypothetical protein